MNPEQQVVELYQQGYFLKQIAKEVFDAASIERVLTILRNNPQSGYVKNRRRTRRRKYFYNTRFFEIINTEAKAYYFGFVAADGWIKFHDGRIPIAVGIEILERDREILDTLHITLGDKAPPVTVRHFEDAKSKAKIMLHSVEMCRDLIAKGCGKDKSHSLANITQYVPDYLHHHFARGYFDGDGSVRREKYRLRYSFRGTYDFLKDLQFILPAKTNLVTSGSWPSLATSSHGQAVDLYWWLYANATIYLIRKHNKAMVALRSNAH